MGVLVGEAIQPTAAQAQITEIPGAKGGATNTSASATGDGAFAIGVSATADGKNAIAIGHQASLRPDWINTVLVPSVTTRFDFSARKAWRHGIHVK